jgi:hypothetical protein
MIVNIVVFDLMFVSPHFCLTNGIKSFSFRLPLNVTVKSLKLLLHWEVLSSNPGLEACYPDRDISYFFQSLPANLSVVP